MPKLAALASAADNICFASWSIRLVYVRGISPHLKWIGFLNDPVIPFLAPPFRRIRSCVFFVAAACVESLVSRAHALPPSQSVQRLDELRGNRMIGPRILTSDELAIGIT